MSAVASFAQQNTDVNRAKAQEITAMLTNVYGLNETQTQEMLRIQVRRQESLAEVAYLKTEDQPLYVQKLKSIEQGTAFSIKRMLTDSQQKIYREQEIELRKRKADVARQLQDQGAAPAEIELALAEME